MRKSLLMSAAALLIAGPAFAQSVQPGRRRLSALRVRSDPRPPKRWRPRQIREPEFRASADRLVARGRRPKGSETVARDHRTG